MKVPEPRKLTSGKWFIQMRLGGQSVSISNYDKNACIREARAVKAEYLAGKRDIDAPAPAAPTLTEAIDAYIAAKSNTLSPSTIRGYRKMQRNSFKSTMPRRLDQIQAGEWQTIVNEEAARCSPKSLRNAFFFIKSVVLFATGEHLPAVSMPGMIPAQKEFLTPEQIRIFVQAIKDEPIAVPALLALSSLRSSEIAALRWEDIAQQPDFIRVSGAVVRDELGRPVLKKQNKNASSARMVPILIPELKAAIERDRKPEGPVLQLTPNRFRDRVNRVCAQNDLPQVGIHGLRHSFASLAYHLQMPEKIAMEIGGWADSGTMHRIYTHIARSDIERYQKAIGDFYSHQPNENANENANESGKC